MKGELFIVTILKPESFKINGLTELQFENKGNSEVFINRELSLLPGATYSIAKNVQLVNPSPLSISFGTGSIQKLLITGIKIQ